MLNMTSIVPEASTSEKSRENWKEVVHGMASFSLV